jgi:hypothetical protein
MSAWLDRKYVNIVASQLRNFKWIDQSKARASCPTCGDSTDNKRKARLYFLGDGNHYQTYCHNCHSNFPIGAFLQRVNPELYREYTLECVREKASGEPEKKETLTFKSPKFMKAGTPLKQLRKISQLEVNHPAKLYVESRKIPPELHYRLFYTPTFNEWVNTIIPDKMSKDFDEARLVIPFFDDANNMFAFQGRALQPSKQRYITVVLDDSKPKIYGLDTVNFNKKFYVLEGPIDSLFLPNAIAMAGSDVPLKVVEQNGVFVYDNEPRNNEIVKKLRSITAANRPIVIWPSSMQHKDINDMIISGYTRDQIISIIDQNTYSGLEAQLKLTMWKKV